MNITNFAKKLAEKPVFKTRIKSDQVKLPEIAIGYFLAPFCAMFANAIFGAYLNRYYVDVLGWTKFGAFATLLPIVSVIFVVLGNLMIGQWIDNTRSTQGKARPYLIIAAPMLIIAIILMFMTPTKGNNAVQMIWIAVSYNLYYALAYPCFYCAHSSMVSLSTRNSESRGLLATLSNAAMVASAGVGASIVVPILLQSFLFVTKDGGIDVDASYSHWRIISIVLCLVSAFGILFYQRAYYRGNHQSECEGREASSEKTAGRLYPQQILVDHHSLFPDFPVWPADQKQFHELLCKMDV